MSEAVMDTENLTDLTFEPLITAQEVDELEEIARDFSRSRRAVLAMLTRSSEQLVGGRSEGACEAMQLLKDMASDYVEHLRCCIEQAECAEARAQAVLIQLEATPEAVRH